MEVEFEERGSGEGMGQIGSPMEAWRKWK